MPVKGSCKLPKHSMFWMAWLLVAIVEKKRYLLIIPRIVVGSGSSLMQSSMNAET